MVLLAFNLRIVIWYLEFSEIIAPISITTWIAFLSIALVLTRFFLMRFKLTLTANWIDSLSIVFLLNVLLTLYLNLNNYGLIDASGSSYIMYVVTVMFQAFIFYVIGRFFLSDSLQYDKLYIYSYIGICFFITVNSGLQPLGLKVDHLNVQGVHLSFSSMFAIFSIITFSVTKGQVNKIAVFFSAILILLFLHSRAALIIFIASFILRYRSNLSFLVISLLVVLFATPFLIYLGSGIAIDERWIEFFRDPFADSSFRSRAIQFTEGLKDIFMYPLTGVFGGQIDSFGFMGFYMHNILSYWRQFGFLAFLILLFFTLYLPFKLEPRLKSVSVINRDIFLLLSPFVLLNTYSAKAFEWYFIWFYFGFCAFLWSQSAKKFNNQSKGSIS